MEEASLYLERNSLGMKGSEESITDAFFCVVAFMAVSYSEKL